MKFFTESYMMHKPGALIELKKRGLVNQTTDDSELTKALDEGSITFYIGFDPTAQSLHLGNLLQILVAKRLQDYGHKPLLLVGGATGLIGDPKESGERTLNELKTVLEWTDRITQQIQPFFNFSGDNAARVVNNMDWTSKISAIELLRDIGKHFSINRMLEREAVSARLNAAGISYTEFSYALLQANDYYELNQIYNCVLQTGGSDQWGNITAGVDFVRRKSANKVHALTTPLLTKSDGGKFGKTEAGTIWLSAALTSPYAFYQFWINTDDADIERMMMVFSLKPVEEIENILKINSENPAARVAQRDLAFELTKLVHGLSETEKVISATNAFFGDGDLNNLDSETLISSLKEINLVELNDDEIGKPILEILSLTQLVNSKSAARRAIEEGGAYLNNQRITEVDRKLEESDLLAGRVVVLRRGKRNLAGVRFGGRD
jgi:tyrosyl-tRNA synthetase